MACSRCGARHGADGIRRHHPGFEFHRAEDMLAEHPDLLDWEGDAEFWWGADWTGPAPTRKRFAA